MRCEDCHGEGRHVVIMREFVGRDGNCWRDELVYPCESCGGSGVAHCCEGERPDLAPERK
jgi:hypothetical protein